MQSYPYVPVNDGAKIYYANTAINDNTDRSELLRLFMERNTFHNDKFPHLSEAVDYYKNTEKGSGEMCDIVEEYAKKYAKEHAKEYAKEYADTREQKRMEKTAMILINKRYPTDEISEISGLSVENIEKLRLAAAHA